MSLADLNVATRRRLRFHAWVLSAWCVFVGFATSWLLLRGFGLRLPAPRYGIAAVAMYGLGLVLGTRIWLVRFSHTVREERGRFGRAGPQDAAALEAEKRARQRRGEQAGGSFDLSNALGYVADLLSLDEAAALLIVPAVLFVIVGFLLLGGLAPVLLMDGVAGLLAEVAVQFVFGALIARRIMRPKSHDEALLTIVGRTWLIGLLLVVASVGAGWLLHEAAPAAASIGDLFR